MAAEIYVGLMSGTSVDAIDAVLVAIHPGVESPRLLAALAIEMPDRLRQDILALCQAGDNEVDRLGVLDAELGQLFADAALAVIRRGEVEPAAVRAIGSHGQTIRHRPSGQIPFTLQIGDPNRIAEITGITTVADFRRRDMATGGQGAPLVPAFHEAVFRCDTEDRVVVNIGGMANITVLPGDQASHVHGFDTGPGNALLDGWHQKHRGGAYDPGGAWAAGGTVHETLLQELLADPWFASPPPRSTGRETFGLPVLEERFSAHLRECPAQDVQATLSEFTARTIADAICRWGTHGGSVFLCGGGAHNADLCRRIAARLPKHRLASTSELGIDPDWVEGMAFAWLAARTMSGLPGNLPAVTGASSPVVLGGIYPGRTGI